MTRKAERAVRRRMQNHPDKVRGRGCEKGLPETREKTGDRTAGRSPEDIPEKACNYLPRSRSLYSFGVLPVYFLNVRMK